MTLPATTDVCDARENTPGEIAIVAPVFNNYGGAQKFGGRIATIACVDDNSRVRDMVAQAGDGRVLVVHGGGSTSCALLGGNLAMQAAKNGWSGIVIYGCARDAEELSAAPIGIRALALAPNRSIKRNSGEVNVPVHFAGVTFAPGQYLLADKDGMIVCEKPL